MRDLPGFPSTYVCTYGIVSVYEGAFQGDPAGTYRTVKVLSNILVLIRLLSCGGLTFPLSRPFTSASAVMSNHFIQIEGSPPSPVGEVKAPGTHGTAGEGEAAPPPSRDIEEAHVEQQRLEGKPSAKPPADGWAAAAMPETSTETPRQRARRLEHQRLRDEFATRGTIPTETEGHTTRKMFKVFGGQEGSNNANQHFMIPSPPGLDHETSALLESEEGSTTSNDDSGHGVSAQLERVESLVREYVRHQNVPKQKELIRHVSVMRDSFEAQQNLGDKQSRAVPPIRRQSAVWKSSQARERENILVLLREFETVEDAVIKWSSDPESAPRECLREITIFRLSVLSALEHHPILLDGILMDLTHLETTIIDYKTKPRRNEWCRSKEAVRRTEVLKAKLRQPDWDEKSPKSTDFASRQPRRAFSLYEFSSNIIQSWLR